MVPAGQQVYTAVRIKTCRLDWLAVSRQKGSAVANDVVLVCQDIPCRLSMKLREDFKRD